MVHVAAPVQLDGEQRRHHALAWPSGESRVKRRDFAQTFDVTDKLARGLLSLLAGEIAQPTAAQLYLESEAAAKKDESIEFVPLEAPAAKQI